MKHTAFLLCLLLSIASLLSGQTATGRLTGTVIDPQGLPLTNAAVSVTGEDSGARFTGASSALGAFSFADVPSGLYTVDVSASGFRREVVRHFKVDVAKENVLAPVRLELGAVSESVEVSAGGGQVQTTNAELSATITMQQIQHLPLVDRSPLALISLQAGAAYNGNTSTVINGQRTSFSNMTMDGINIQDNFIRANALDFQPNNLLIDEVSEFTLTTQNGNAALGMGASQVNFITPSGTNQYHGSVYWFNRNSALSANEWFSNQAGTPQPFLNLNQFGGTMGGPIVKDKLLFYSNYEGYRKRHKQLDNTTILTSNARSGIFAYRDNNNRVQHVNVLSLAGVTLDPKVAALMQSVPGGDKINNFNTGDGLNTAGYQFNAQDDTNKDNVTTRIDYLRSANHMFSGTYHYNTDLLDRPDIENGFHVRPVVSGADHVHFLSAAWRWTARPSLTNELRGGMNIAPGSFSSSENTGSQLFSGFLFTNPVVSFRPEGRATNTYDYMDNANWQHGKHGVRFGGMIQHVYASPYDQSGLLPTYSIGLGPSNPLALNPSQFPGGITSTQLDIATSLLTTLGGIIGSAGQTFNVANRTSGFVPGQQFLRHYSLNNYSFYGQDSWKVSPRLTVNAGVRWEYEGRFDERDGLMLAPIFTSLGVKGTLLSNATIDLAGNAVGRPLYSKDLNNFAPNVGVAFDPFGDGKTSIRAGYTINYVNDEIISAADNATNSNAGLQTTLSNQDLVATMSGNLPKFPVPAFQMPLQPLDNFILNPIAAMFAMDPKLRTPYVQQWTVGVQRQISRDTVVEARYAGNHGTRLLRGFDYNQVIVKQNGFLDDFIRARNNAFLSQTATGSFDANYNSGIPGSRPLTIFPQLPFGGFLDNGIVQDLIRTGEVGQLAAVYYVNGITGPIQFTPNPNTFVADVITNYSNSTYNALQLEIRRRSVSGIEFQANYSLSKVLTDSIGGSRVRFDPFLDFNSPQLERSRADFDVTHVFNGNIVVPLPLGPNHRFSYKPLNRLLGDWTLGSIVSWQSGAPFSIVSGRGTLNRSSRSSLNTAVTSLTGSQLDQVVKFQMTPNGPYIVSPAVLNPADNTGVNADGAPAYKSQIFFNPQPGQLGTLQRRFFNGPSAFTCDLKIDKQIPITERQRVRVEASFINLFNHPVFYSGDQNINSTQFGKIGATLVPARVLQFGARYTF